MIKFFLILFSISLHSQSTFNRSEWSVWKTYQGCISVREKVLIDYSLKPVIYDVKKCSVVSGEWKTLWENKTFFYSKDLDIDHTVPLSWTWTHGADKWTKKMKEDYANNYKSKYYLLPLSIKANRTKGDRGPDEWLPEANRCLYITTFENIVNENKLNLTDKEKIKYEELKRNECK